MLKNEHVTKVYKMGEVDLTVIKDLSLSIDDGEFVAIVGPSGSGKSTVLNILGCLDKPTEGKVTVEDVDVTKLNRTELAHFRGENIGFIFQSFNLFPELSALENVMLPMSYGGVPYKKRRTRAQELLEEVGLAHRMYHLPSMMSGGEQQRTAIARSLSNDPDLILADEPTGNLPSEKGEEILTMLENLNRKGVTVVMVTHNQEQGNRARRKISIMDGSLYKDVIVDHGVING